MDIIISTNIHKVCLKGSKQWRKVDTYSAEHRNGIGGTAHNFASPEAATRALLSFRHAAYTQGG